MESCQRGEPRTKTLSKLDFLFSIDSMSMLPKRYQGPKSIDPFKRNPAGVGLEKDRIKMPNSGGNIEYTHLEPDNVATVK